MVTSVYGHGLIAVNSLSVKVKTAVVSVHINVISNCRNCKSRRDVAARGRRWWNPIHAIHVDCEMS